MCNKIIDNIEVDNLENEIKKKGVLCYFRATPFSEYGEYNYNGLLAPDFFFDNLFSCSKKCEDYCNRVLNEICFKNKKTIIIIGNQGCGKTTFLHYVERQANALCSFKILDFDKNTSNPKLSDYIEIFSSYLYNAMCNDKKNNNSYTNKLFYNLYRCNMELIHEKLNADNKIIDFFSKFPNAFISGNTSETECNEFIKSINDLFFNQLLSLVVLWHISYFPLTEAKPIAFCLDNLDVLINGEIITGFFEEYYIFLRNIDSIVQQLFIVGKDGNEIKLEYNKIFTFVFSCRQHTWAKVRKLHIHQGNIIDISTYACTVTDVFDKNEILEKREEYIRKNELIYKDFLKPVYCTKELMNDMKESHNIYNLFNDDYRQCTITFEKLLECNPNLLSTYTDVKKQILSKQSPLYGARGLIYKALFDLFNSKDLFKSIGVLGVDSETPPVSDARIILTYLDNHTYNRTNGDSIQYEKIINDFEGIVTKERINCSISQMFNLGIKNSLWNELVAFVEIDSENIENCEKTRVFITKAGHEYLDLISTHFEFFNSRVVKKRNIDAALFDPINLKQYIGSADYIYNFQETITNVMEIVENCCNKMSNFYETTMFKRFGGKEQYLNSEFVFDLGKKKKVFHGERIIHTHIRYIDQYRQYILKDSIVTPGSNKINEILIDFIEKYINIGKKFPNVLSLRSYELFEKFETKINNIKITSYSDYITRIDV